MKYPSEENKSNQKRILYTISENMLLNQFDINCKFIKLEQCIDIWGEILDLSSFRYLLLSFNDVTI